MNATLQRLMRVVDAGVVYYDGGYRFTEPKETP